MPLRLLRSLSYKWKLNVLVMKHQMKGIIAVLFSIVLLTACQSRDKQTSTDENTPGPVGEEDKSRYNLNASDEALYGTTDTLKQDSLETADSLRKRDSL